MSKYNSLSFRYSEHLVRLQPSQGHGKLKDIGMNVLFRPGELAWKMEMNIFFFKCRLIYSSSALKHLVQSL